MYSTKPGKHFPHKSTDAKVYPFAEGDKDFLEKNRDVVCGHSMAFTRKAVVD